MIRQGCERLFNRRICTAEVNDILFPHHIGHYLGMDVHDTGLISRSRRLQQGMVVTIEPGLYIPDSPRYPEQFRGIGIRIEDDVAVGESETSSRILTIEAPKEVDEIQDLMASFKSIN